MTDVWLADWSHCCNLLLWACWLLLIQIHQMSLLHVFCGIFYAGKLYNKSVVGYHTSAISLRAYSLYAPRKMWLTKTPRATADVLLYSSPLFYGVKQFILQKQAKQSCKAQEARYSCLALPFVLLRRCPASLILCCRHGQIDPITETGWRLCGGSLTGASCMWSMPTL